MSKQRADALRAARIAARVEQHTLATAAGMSASTLSRLETGRQDLDPITYAAVLTALGHVTHGRAHTGRIA